MKNETAQIPLSNGGYALIDADLFETFSQWTWRKDRDGYAVRSTTVNAKQTVLVMHRLVNQTPFGLDTDHINHDRLDNRRENLRSCTHLENMRNCRSRSKRLIGTPETHCSHGHEFNSENTYIHKERKICRACNHMATIKYRQKKGAA